MNKYLKLACVLMLALFAFSCSEDDNNPADSNDNGEANFLTGTITENLTLTADKTYVLRGGVFIGNDTDETILTIEAGTTIYGESSTDGMLVIRRGSKIMANGTANAPIVFTSDKPVGQRDRQDWGGLIINGRAPLNSGDEAFGEGGTGYYGGTNPDDNSGVLRYVRVEFAGQEISPDNELNGIAFQGVGRGTTVDYVQVHMNKDDGIEFFGGTVNAKHLVVTGCADDQFDWTDGWQGKGQFWVCQQYADDGDKGIEADNNAEDNTATPRSNPMLCNLTIIGNATSGGIGMLLREGTAATIANAVVMNFGDCGIDIDHAETFNNAWNGGLNGNLAVKNSIFFDNTEIAQSGESDEPGFPFTTDLFIHDASLNNRFEDPGLIAPYNTTAPDFRPNSGSISVEGFWTPPSDGFFESVDYVGGVNPASNWLSGWTNFSVN